MDSLHNEIKTSKDYQLKACYHRMKDLYNNCNDNLTGSITKTLQYAIKKEAELRGLDLESI